MSKTRGRTSLVVQWLRLCISTAGGVGSVTGGGTKIANAAVQHSLKKKKKKTEEIGARTSFGLCHPHAGSQRSLLSFLST